MVSPSPSTKEMAHHAKYEAKEKEERERVFVAVVHESITPHSLIFLLSLFEVFIYIFLRAHPPKRTQGVLCKRSTRTHRVKEFDTIALDSL